MTKKLHCWKDRHEHAADVHGWGSDAWAKEYIEPSGTCVLKDGHSGDHDFTDDAEIGVYFATSVTS